MPRSRRLAALSTAALALLASGCGDAGKGKLSAKQGGKLTAFVNAAQRAVDEGKCNVARDQATKGANAAAGLKGDLDAEMQDNLVEGFKHLGQRVDADCDKPQKETPTPTETVEETVTEAPTTAPTPSPTPSPTPTPTPTEAPTSEPTTAPTQGNGGFPSGTP